MEPPHSPGRPGDPGEGDRTEAGLPARMVTWIAPMIGACLVLIIGLPWAWAVSGAFSVSLTGRLLLVLGGIGIVAVLVLRIQNQWLRTANRLRLAEQSLALLSEALLQARRELEQRRESEQALRDADRSKDEFMATLCHELCNPLAAIDHAGELLINHDQDEQQRLWAVRIIRDQTRQLARLIDDLLDLSRIASGTLTLNLRSVSLPDLIRSSVDVARPFLEDANQQVELQIDEAPMWVEVDPSRIQQVLINLLSNACRYSDPGRSITIVARPEGSEVLLSVKDQGIGVEPALLPRIFGIFVRGEAARDRSPTGLGIGLRLVKLIIERHEGSIVARSEGIGRGSNFEIRLPLKKAPPHLSGEGSNPGLPVPLRLLLVDDNRPMVEALRLLLQRDGHEVRMARSGQEAIEAIAIERPDLVLLDLELPDTDGIEVALAIQELGEASVPPMIAMTGSAQPADHDRLQEVGVRIVIQKPVRIEELRETFRRILREHAGNP